jgi:hypothetical protein
VRSSFGNAKLTLMQVLELVSGQLKVSRVYPLEVENADLDKWPTSTPALQSKGLT